MAKPEKKLIITEQRRAVIEHCAEYVFLYHLSDDKGKFSQRVLKRMFHAGLLDYNRGGIDHDESCYELSGYGHYVYGMLMIVDAENSVILRKEEWNTVKYGDVDDIPF